MKAKKIFSLVILFGAILSMSCSKDSITGMDGAIGEQGPQGEQGIQGPEGPQGLAGQDGAALGVPGPTGQDGADGQDGATGPQGETGAQGPQGEQGPAGQDGTAQGVPGPEGPSGTNGQDGATGATGAQGPKGDDGQDGADGSALARSFFYQVSTESGSGITLNVPQLTDGVLVFDAILFYMRVGDVWYSIPGAGPGNNYSVRVFSQTGLAQFRFHTSAGGSYNISAGDIDTIKIVIIDSQLGSKSGNNPLAELKVSGIDTNDYYAVMDYLELEY